MSNPLGFVCNIMTLPSNGGLTRGVDSSLDIRGYGCMPHAFVEYESNAIDPLFGMSSDVRKPASQGSHVAPVLLLRRQFQRCCHPSFHSSTFHALNLTIRVCYRTCGKTTDILWLDLQISSWMSLQTPITHGIYENLINLACMTLFQSSFIARKYECVLVYFYVLTIWHHALCHVAKCKPSSLT